MFVRRILPLLLISAAVPAMAQNAPAAGAQAKSQVQSVPVQPSAPAQQSAAPGTPAVTPTPVPVPPPVVLAADWKKRDVQDLLAFVEKVGEDGLDANDYNPAGLREALAGDDDDFRSKTATATFLKLAHDLMFGHAPAEARIDWHVQDDSISVYDQQGLLDRAAKSHNVADTLRSLLPTHPQYAGLKGLLAKTTDATLREKVRLNMDRWRWLPRDLGNKYVIVNVPAYTVSVVENGTTLNRRRAVAGALKTPTPQLSAVITGAIFNPWWEVPSSIAGEVAGKKGYVSVPMPGGGVRWRQPPGPTNALGRVKLVMANPYAIYLHDTNARHLFDTQARAYSHGCIRTEDAVGFAETLLEGTEWDRTKIDQTIAGKKATQANLAQPLPVYIVYFTVAATSDGPGQMVYKDLYGRDRYALAGLNDEPIPAPPAKPAAKAPAKAAAAAKPAVKPAAKRTTVASTGG